MIKCEPEQEFRSGLDKVNGLDERQYAKHLGDSE